MARIQKTVSSNKNGGIAGQLKERKVNMETAIQKEYLTGKQLAEKLNVSIKSIAKWTAARRLPGAIKAGRVWRYQTIEIEKRLLSGNLLLK
jgi:hypothetical protein